MSSGGWLIWQWTSTSPGMRTLPRASTLSTPFGIATRARGPALRIRSPSTTTTESSRGAPPVPSMRRAPTIAIGPDARVGGCWPERAETATALRTASEKETTKRTATSYGRPKGLRYGRLRGITGSAALPPSLKLRRTTVALAKVVRAALELPAATSRGIEYSPVSTPPVDDDVLDALAFPGVGDVHEAVRASE